MRPDSINEIFMQKTCGDVLEDLVDSVSGNHLDRMGKSGIIELYL